MSHYFSDHQEVIKNRREIPFRFLAYEYSFLVDDGVFSNKQVDPGTQALLSFLKDLDLKGQVADLGCGYGVIGVVLSSLFPVEVTGFDINPRAVALANENFKRYQVTGKNYQRDGLEGSYDWVVSNPPIRVGKKIMYGLFKQAYAALKPGGSFVFVIRKQHGAKTASAFVEKVFGVCDLLGKKKGYYIYRAVKH